MKKKNFNILNNKFNKKSLYKMIKTYIKSNKNPMSVQLFLTLNKKNKPNESQKQSLIKEKPFKKFLKLLLNGENLSW